MKLGDGKRISVIPVQRHNGGDGQILAQPKHVLEKAKQDMAALHAGAVDRTGTTSLLAE